MRIQLADPSAFTPPYDHALAAALARAGADVELVTSRFLYGPVPAARGYEVNEFFYRRTARRGLDARGRMAFKLGEHVPDMLRYRRHARGADVVHFQWLTVQPLDVALLPRGRPLVLTAHDVIPREPRPGQIAATRRLVNRMDRVIVHSEHGAERLRAELGAPADRIRVVPHGAFDYLTELPDEAPLPPELREVEGPVVLCFGLWRPYKGIDVLLEAFRAVEGAELWVVGMPRMPVEPLEELAARVGATVRFVPRFVTEPEIPAFFRRADVVALPYREIDQSGVLYTALAFGSPMVLSDVGGFSEVAGHGAARLVPPGDPAALAAVLNELVGSPGERERLAAAARAAAAGPYSWDEAARRTLAVYEEVLAP
ncbi:MAG: glycosyltransferase family 4 protein [Thermoleophilaceae bacterium]|nr:glycosyltransferase family 4 protein [Thermoleophilaceae bacterium]